MTKRFRQIKGVKNWAFKDLFVTSYAEVKKIAVFNADVSLVFGVSASFRNF